MARSAAARGAEAGGKAKRFASARCQLAYWADGDLRIVNFLSGKAFAATPRALEIIHFFMTPRTIRAALVQFDRFTRESVGEAILKLIETGLLLEVESAEWRRDRQLESWNAWLPGGAFHFLTKNPAFFGGDWTDEQKIEALPKTPAPAQFKAISGAESIRLGRHPPDKDSFFDTLHARRTHRAFSRAELPLKAVEVLLHTTWGVQKFLDGKFFGKLPGKTSPSGGARHPIEVYLAALRVAGLKPGMYHYRPDAHALEKMPARVAPEIARAFCADQPYVADAAALFIMTAVFERTMWKYRHPRGYRIVLLDAGHLGQTFCLTATRMGLAPFSTGALNDSLIERDLGVDGISESVLYVVGVGMPPGG